MVIAVEVHSPKGFGRVRMRRIPDVSGDSLVPFVCDVVEKGSEILTDGWRGYNKLSKCGYQHERVVFSDTGDPAHVSMPGVHRIAALLKRWLLSTHQGSVSGKHLDYYLDEYTFRFNRRTSRSRGMLFYRLIEQAMMTAPIAVPADSPKKTQHIGDTCVKWIPPFYKYMPPRPLEEIETDLKKIEKEIADMLAEVTE